MFSGRVPSALAPNRLTQLVERLRREQRDFLDLTVSNPTNAGFAYPSALLTPLGDARALSYRPHPLGMLEARAAVASDYARRGITVAPEFIALTASSSESYSFLFKVLCDPGDEVLVPRPSYPLFTHLTALDGVVARSYDLEYHDAWSIDLDSVRRELSPRTRAILLVSPNNPTGSFVTATELDALCAECVGRPVALIADEVFADYELTPGSSNAACRPLTRDDVLVFSLGGLSKTVGLPQVKLGWLVAAGPDALVGDAMHRLELVADTYLSVSTPVQMAAQRLLTEGAAVRHQIQQRITANHRWLAARVIASPACRLLRAEGGWSAVIQVPTLGPEEDLVLDVLDSHRVLVHPGYFFDFPRESYLVVSLLTPPAEFADGIERMFTYFARKASA